MSKIILSGYIEVPLDDLVQVTSELPRHIELTRAEPGCLVFEVTQDQNNAHRFNVYEVFSDRQAFDVHQARVRRSKWGEVTQRVARHYEISEKSV